MLLTGLEALWVEVFDAQGDVLVLRMRFDRVTECDAVSAPCSYESVALRRPPAEMLESRCCSDIDPSCSAARYGPCPRPSSDGFPSGGPSAAAHRNAAAEADPIQRSVSPYLRRSGKSTGFAMKSKPLSRAQPRDGIILEGRLAPEQLTRRHV
jgi:hypothetical protein